MAEKLEANQYAHLQPGEMPKHPYTKISGKSARHICSVCLLSKDNAVHQDRERVAA